MFVPDPHANVTMTRADHDSMRDELCTLRTRNTALEARNTALELTIRENAAAYEADMRSLRETNTKILAELESLRKDKAELCNEVASLRKQLDGTRAASQPEE